LISASIASSDRRRSKTAIALGLLEQALAQDLPRGFVLADAGYGSDTAFREAVTVLGLPYVVGVGPTTSVRGGAR
jgi:SRSO17 transposase